MSIWEVARLERAGRMMLDRGLDRWLTAALADDRVAVIPVTPEIALTGAAFSGRLRDPADQLIYATAVEHDAHPGEPRRHLAGARLSARRLVARPRYRRAMSFLFRKPAEMPTAESALPGRESPILVTRPHLVLGTPLTPPYPEGTERAIVGMGCFWGAERLFWQLPGVHTTAVGYAGGITPNPTYEETCTGRTGHAEVVLAVYHPERISYEELLKVFWEGHDPTQGMRQGNDVGTSTARRSIGRPKGSALRRRSHATATPVLGGSRTRLDHHGARRGRPVLLRRGVPPAVPRREPERLLRARWDGGRMPDRHRRRYELITRRSSSPPAPAPPRRARRRAAGRCRRG